MTSSIRTTYDVQIEDVEYLRQGDKPFLARLFRPQGTGPLPGNGRAARRRLG